MMQPTITKDVENFPFFYKERIAEPIVEWVRCRLSWSNEWVVKLITEDNRDITDRFPGILYDDAKRLADTELDCYLAAKRGVQVINESMTEEITTFSKETIEQLLIGWGLSLMLIITDVIVFLGTDCTSLWYGDRKMKTEDVLISIDNTFEMKYKDNYNVLFPQENTKEKFLAFCTIGNKGMMFKKENSKYCEGISEFWQMLLSSCN